jgi:hypothetical protein
MKRIIKMGREEVLRNLSTNNFDDLFEHIIGEELKFLKQSILSLAFNGELVKAA